MDWITLSEIEVQNRLTKPELASLKTAATAVGQTPDAVLASAVAAVIGEVRGYVGVRNKLGEVGTIPSELESTTLALIRRYLFTRLPGMDGLFDDLRQTEAKDAIQRLRDVSKGDFVFAPPTDEAPSEQQASTPSPSFCSRKLHFGRSDGEGL